MEMNVPGLETIYTDRYAACFELYLRHNGRNLAAIEREMRALGFTDFHRRILYTRKERGTQKPGWIEKFGWRTHLKSGSFPRNAGAPGCMSAKHEQPPGDRNGRDLTPPQSGDVAGEGACVPGVNPAPRNPKSAIRDPKSFGAWLKQVSPELTWDWPYQKYIYKYLQRVTEGTCKRLMIFMPPRHGKSELVTVRYAGWRLWNDPKMRVIVSSYNQKLADRFSRSIRKLLSEEEDNQLRSADCVVRNEGPPPTLDSDATVRKRHSSDYPQCTSDASQPNSSAVRTPHSAIERIFPRTIRNINTASQWETALGGGVKAVGVGAGVTGFGGQLIVIDDPVKSRAEAESATYRERLWDWYRNDLYTRLEPNAAVILIQTRWHQDDLAGRLLQEMQTGGDRWEVIDLPALAEHRELHSLSLKGTKLIAQGKAESRNPGIDANIGTDPERVELAGAVVGVAPLRGADVSLAYPGVTLGSLVHPRLLTLSPSATGSTDPLGRAVGAALCPDRFDESKLADIRRQLGTYNFSALYQQHPTPAEGGIFKRQWFTRFVDHAPVGLKWKRGYDLAVSTKTNSCFTASFRVARDGATGDLYIADGFRERIEYPDQKRYIIGRIREERDTEHGIEKALHGLALLQELRREAGIFGSRFQGIDVTADKVTRALTWAPLAEEGKVVLVRAPWNRAFLDELANFPAGESDDQIDAVSLAFSMLTRKGGKACSF